MLLLQGIYRVPSNTFQGAKYISLLPTFILPLSPVEQEDTSSTHVCIPCTRHSTGTMVYRKVKKKAFCLLKGCIYEAQIIKICYDK